MFAPSGRHWTYVFQKLCNTTLRALLREPDAARSHRNVTCGGLNFRGTRLHEAQTFLGDSWIRLYHKHAEPWRRLGERRSSYRQKDGKETPTASSSNRCERCYGSRKDDRALPRGRRSKREGYSLPEPIARTVMSSRATQNDADFLCHAIRNDRHPQARVHRLGV
jgi:hypothetical protein